MSHLAAERTPKTLPGPLFLVFWAPPDPLLASVWIKRWRPTSIQSTLSRDRVPKNWSNPRRSIVFPGKWSKPVFSNFIKIRVFWKNNVPCIFPLKHVTLYYVRGPNCGFPRSAGITKVAKTGFAYKTHYILMSHCKTTIFNKVSACAKIEVWGI